MFEGFNFEPGRITYDSYTYSPTDQTDLEWINEDLFQVEYPKNYLLDVGWYENYDKGIFVIYIIKDCNWEVPISRTEYKNVNELYEGMQKCIITVKELIDI